MRIESLTVSKVTRNSQCDKEKLILCKITAQSNYFAQVNSMDFVPLELVYQLTDTVPFGTIAIKQLWTIWLHSSESTPPPNTQ